MQNLATQVENLEQQRTKWLIVNLVGFACWDGLRIVDRYLLAEEPHPVLTGFIIAATIIWMLSLIQILRLGRKVKGNLRIKHILNDDLVELNRFKTWRITLVAVIFTQVILMVLGSFVVEFSGLLAAELSIFVAIVTAIGGFLYFNRDSYGV